MIEVRDIAWAAGFLEGEGHFSRTDSGVQCTQVQREPLERLSLLFGGPIRERKAKPGHKDFHVWSISGSNAAGAMMTLWTLMSPIRRAQIERSLAIWKAQANTRGPAVSRGNFCRRGHNQSTVGRSQYGCKQCRKDYAREHQREYRAKAKELPQNG